MSYIVAYLQRINNIKSWFYIGVKLFFASQQRIERLEALK